jgi:hypothetical protein
MVSERRVYWDKGHRKRLAAMGKRAQLATSGIMTDAKRKALSTRGGSLESHSISSSSSRYYKFARIDVHGGLMGQGLSYRSL